ncbi:hypothetical protein GCM10027275_23590 [Rhabdobacter roseus]|uniref:Putative membrane-bound dehydrogenase-like protein n=1 Tax=Rhabdobacter roseus TaxID=1655419 RepID=A0A840TXC2_9BACT|nr:PVC-type heme-binding CxxCH protein [Rhabdobacter roseus]MBB5284299.1 putative membrane-bound dehydrogenase-like protein [Rhabdobacter roseus]
MKFFPCSLFLAVALLWVVSPVFSQPTFSKQAFGSAPHDSLTEQEKRFPENALTGLTVAAGLEASLFASEPLLANPINIDVDHRGRVWVLEAYNYRPSLNGTQKSPLGDRILILEDTNGDGKADKTTTFYQGPELNAPLGIWVMGNQALVSQSPYVWLFTDDNGDGKADRKEIVFRGVGGEQHDHGIHAFVFGPDGKFYFSYGSKGKQLLDGRGRRLLDKYERPIDFRKYRNGLVFRCEPDFTHVEILGENFRNGFEVAVDSYGSVWQSDRDEEGNEGVRINYVMEGGNFGYMDEMTGASWRIYRTNLEEEIGRRHWHQNDPGVVPNLLQTGNGAPMGMAIYEGTLLPRTYWGQILHCDAGANALRAYTVENDGAGYKASMTNILEGTSDHWFRPSDVCVAPDGSLIVSDWYDPVASENRAGDFRRGRIYRLAPPGTSYTTPTYDYTTPEGATLALQNPNLSVRYMAWNALVAMGRRAEPELGKLLHSAYADPRLRARALWVLNRIEGISTRHHEACFRAINPNLRITALRTVRQRNSDPIEYIKLLVSDRDPQVRRECALAINHNHTYEAEDVWVSLAKKYNGQDRWYLEALGIGAFDQWERLFPAWLATTQGNPLATAASRDIIWRSRTKQAIPWLATLAGDSAVALNERARYFRAFDFIPRGYEKTLALLDIAKGDSPQQVAAHKMALFHLDPDYVRDSPRGMTALQKLLDENYGTSDYIDLVVRYSPESENQRLLQLAMAKYAEPIGRDAGRQLLKQAGSGFVWEKVNTGPDDGRIALLSSLQLIGSRESLNILSNVVLSDHQSRKVRREAIRFLSGSWEGEDMVLTLLKSGQLEGDIKAAAVEGIRNAFRKEIRTEADRYTEFAEDSSEK